MAEVYVRMWTVPVRYHTPGAGTSTDGDYTSFLHRSIEMFVPAYRLEGSDSLWHQHQRLWTWNWWDPA